MAEASTNTFHQMFVVELIDLDARTVLFDDGITVPITNTLDDDGDELPWPVPVGETRAIVAGPLPDGRWFSCELFPCEAGVGYIQRVLN